VIPLGILAAAGGAVASVDSYDLLETEILTSTSSSITFASLGDYAAEYQHLQIRTVTRCTTSGTDYEVVSMTFNGDTAANYSWHQLTGATGSVTSYAAPTQSSIRAGLVLRNGNTANAFSSAIIDILDPFEGTKYPTARTLAGSPAGGQIIGLYSGSWRNTASFTSIALDAGPDSFSIGSRFSLYGLKASA